MTKISLFGEGRKELEMDLDFFFQQTQIE